MLLIGIVLGVHFITITRDTDSNSETEQERASTALGKVIATAIHQTVTDPYFVPLEQLSHYLEYNPDVNEIRVDLLAKWASDNYMPVGFVRDLIMGTTQIDHPASPFALEEVVNRVEAGAKNDNPRGLIQINTFHIDRSKYWLGYLKVPYQSTKPRQIAGVFFSIDEYLERDAPRLLNDMIHRARFPLIPFQANQGVVSSNEVGFISFRILTDRGDTYFQQGQTFEPENLIYAESDHYPEPIVCMQRGWDLEIFSNAPEISDSDMDEYQTLIIIFIELILIALILLSATKIRIEKD